MVIQEIQDRSNIFTCGGRRGKLRTGTGKREGAPEVSEIVMQTGRDPVVAIDELTAAILRAQMQQVDDPYVFTDAADGSEPGKPDSVSQSFCRMRKRAGLDGVQFHQLRKFVVKRPGIREALVCPGRR